VQNIIAGALRIRVWQFALGTLLSCLPGIIAWTIFGSQINRLLRGTGELSWWAVGAGIVALAAFVFLTRYCVSR
jgi:uncharacterized membrane protein YdjX (TVP38/TMEM64 family)